MKNYIELSPTEYSKLYSPSQLGGRVYLCPDCLKYGIGLYEIYYNIMAKHITTASCIYCKYNPELYHEKGFNLTVEDWYDQIFQHAKTEKVILSYCNRFKIKQ